MEYTAVSLTISWWLVALAYVTGSVCFLSSFEVLRHRMGAYGARNLLFMTCAALLYVVALFTSTVVTLLAVSYSSPAASSPLTLTVDPGLATVAFAVPFLFVLFGFFLAGHPDAHRYLRRPLGVLAVAVGTTASQFLLVLAVKVQASWVLVESYALGVVVLGMVVVPCVVYAALVQQHSARGTTWSRALFAATLAVAVEAMHVMSLRAMTWTYDGTVAPQYPLHPLLIPLGLLAGLSVVALAASLVRSRVSFHQDRASSQTFSLSVYMMDHDQRVLVTSSCALPTLTMESAYLGQGSFDAFNRDFLRLLNASLHWEDAFTTLHALSNSDDVPQASVLVFSQFLHAACQLAHTLQLSLGQLGFLYKAPIDDRLVLVSVAAHAGRMTESGIYRWAPREVVDEFLRKQHGGVKAEGGGNQKMIQVLGAEYMEEADGEGWPREFERYYQAYQLDIEQRRVSPRPSIVDVRIAVPALPFKTFASTDAAKPLSPHSRAASARRQSGAVSPASSGAAATTTADSAMHSRGRDPTTGIDVVQASDEALRLERTAASGLERSLQWTVLDDAINALSSPLTSRSDGCQLYVGMFLARVTGTQLSVLLHRYGPSHAIPSVRIRLPAATPKAELSDDERHWLAAQMQDPSVAPLPIAANAASFPSSPPHFQDDLARFQRAFHTAVAELSALLGGGKHVAFGKLLSVHPVSLSSTVHVLVFCESIMTPHFPLGYDRATLTFVPSKVFEALNGGRWTNALPRDWISQALQSTTRSSDRSRAWMQSKADFLSSEAFSPRQTRVPAAGAVSTRSTTPRTGDRLLDDHRGTPFTSRTTSRHVAAEAGSRPGSRPTSQPTSRSASRPLSRPGSKPGSRQGSRASSRHGSARGSPSESRENSRRSSYEVKEKSAVMDGQRVTLVTVNDTDELREKEERRRRRRERKLRQELEMQHIEA